jgi:hypothetical protein
MIKEEWGRGEKSGNWISGSGCTCWEIRGGIATIPHIRSDDRKFQRKKKKEGTIYRAPTQADRIKPSDGSILGGEGAQPLREKIQREAGGTMAELMGSQEKNFFAGLVDFGFRQQQVRRLVKILYVIAVLGGFVAVVAEVVLGFQQTQSQGLTALVAGIAAFFVWVLLSRLLLELALVMVRTAEGIERATHASN